MAFQCEFDCSRQLLFIFLEGTVDLREALKMLVNTVGDGRFAPRYDALLDSMGAQYVGAVEGAWAVSELLKHSHLEFETHIAIATADRDLYDLVRLGAVRLNESGGPLMEIFPTLQEARQQLVVD